MLMYETEDTANRMSKQVRSAVPGAVTLESVDTAELDAPGAHMEERLSSEQR